jgi:hypothetical protein
MPYVRFMARYPTAEELDELIHHYFDANGVAVSYDAGEGRGEARGAVFWVDNLVANLARIDRNEWPDYVAWHFGHLTDGPPDIPSDYAQARRRLRVRLASSAWVDQLPSKEIVRPVADDLYQVLMIVIEDGASTVPPDSLKAWNQNLAKVWDEAQKNTSLDEPRERRAMLKPTGEHLTWIRGSWWVSSLLLDLGRYLSPQSPYGGLAMVPVRDALFLHEITDAGFVYSLREMIEFALKIYFEGTDQVSPHVYWWRDGSISRLVAYEDGRVRPVWGGEFRKVLAELETQPDLVAMN